MNNNSWFCEWLGVGSLLSSQMKRGLTALVGHSIKSLFKRSHSWVCKSHDWTNVSDQIASPVVGQTEPKKLAQECAITVQYDASQPCSASWFYRQQYCLFVCFFSHFKHLTVKLWKPVKVARNFFLAFFILLQFFFYLLFHMVYFCLK